MYILSRKIKVAILGFVMCGLFTRGLLAFRRETVQDSAAAVERSVEIENNLIIPTVCGFIAASAVQCLRGFDVNGGVTFCNEIIRIISSFLSPIVLLEGSSFINKTFFLFRALYFSRSIYFAGSRKTAIGYFAAAALPLLIHFLTTQVNGFRSIQQERNVRIADVD